jgi:hypothetical protein
MNSNNQAFRSPHNQNQNEKYLDHWSLSLLLLLKLLRLCTTAGSSSVQHHQKQNMNNAGKFDIEKTMGRFNTQHEEYASRMRKFKQVPSDDNAFLCFLDLSSTSSRQAQRTQQRRAWMHLPLLSHVAAAHAPGWMSCSSSYISEGEKNPKSKSPSSINLSSLRTMIQATW